MKRKLLALVVEDSRLIAERLLDLLSELDNIEQSWHGDSYAEGRKILEERAIDLVLLDINLPDKSGIELLRFMKATGLEAKVIMVTNETNPFYRQVCMELGAHGYFDKSNDFEKLREAIEIL